MVLKFGIGDDIIVAEGRRQLSIYFGCAENGKQNVSAILMTE